MAYNEQVIQQVQSLNDIVEIISGYIPLKRAGRNFKACCPFHEEKTGSFMVSPDKQIFHCFGCSAGGDVFSFVMKYEQLNFPEAVRRLAERAHFQLPETSNISPEKKTETERLYEMYAFAAQFYHAQFKHPAIGKSARDYWAKRGFSEKEVEAFQIGYAPSEWKKLYEFLSSKGFKDQELVRSGLILKSAQGTFYDIFRNRLMFPIANAQGKMLAFGGRAMDAETTPKYLNSPESSIFHKRREMYGLYLAKRTMGAGDIRFAFIVEGYLDCIRMHSGGFSNTVATLGTALTNEHVRILKRYADEAIVVYDGDKAGEQASLRGLDIFLEEGMPVKVVVLPQGFDPDDLIREQGPEAMQKLIDVRQDFFDFKLTLLMRKFNKGDSLGLLKITSEFLDSISRIQNPVLVDRYLRKLSASLGVEENSLRSELAKLKTKHKPQIAAPVSASSSKVQQKPKPSAVLEKEPPIETHLLSLLIHNLSYVHKFQNEFPDYSFTGAMNKEIYNVLVELSQKTTGGGYPVAARLLGRLSSEALKSYASKLSVMSDTTEEERERDFAECLKQIKGTGREDALKDIRKRIAQAEALGDQVLLDQLMRTYQELLAARS